MPSRDLESGDFDEDDDQEEDDGQDDTDDDGESGTTEPAHDDVARETPRPSRSVRKYGRPRGPGGMGRPPKGPPVRAPRPEAIPMNGAAETEVAPDISQWPGTAEAAAAVGRHTSTIKAWRTQNRIRAIQDESGCWRYHPDDLAECVDLPDTTDPGAVLAAGMSAIVAQGTSASERLLTMTELATSGLKDAAGVLATELKAAYARIRELEKERVELLNQSAVQHAAGLEHERRMKVLDNRHALAIAGASETSQRIAGLLAIVGPIAASIGARLLGDMKAAEGLDQKTAGAPAPASTGDDRLPFEARISIAMSRLCAALRALPEPAFAGLRAMMPDAIARALDVVRTGKDQTGVGESLAVLVEAARALSDLQFLSLRPIAPADVIGIIGDIRELFRRASAPPEEGAPPQ